MDDLSKISGAVIESLTAKFDPFIFNVKKIVMKIGVNELPKFGSSLPYEVNVICGFLDTDDYRGLEHRILDLIRRDNLNKAPGFEFENPELRMLFESELEKYANSIGANPLQKIVSTNEDTILSSDLYKFVFLLIKTISETKNENDRRLIDVLDIHEYLTQPDSAIEYSAPDNVKSSIPVDGSLYSPFIFFILGILIILLFYFLIR